MPYILSHPGSYEGTFSTILEENVVILSGEESMVYISNNSSKTCAQKV